MEGSTAEGSVTRYLYYITTTSGLRLPSRSSQHAHISGVDLTGNSYDIVRAAIRDRNTPEPIPANPGRLQRTRDLANPLEHGVGTYAVWGYDFGSRSRAPTPSAGLCQR